MTYYFEENPKPLYTPDTGYGFLAERPFDSACHPEFYGSFLFDSDEDLPAIFIADTAPGTYAVTIQLQGDGFVFTGQRQLCEIISKGTKVLHFAVKVGDIIAAADKKRYHNNRIVLTFTENISVLSIHITPVTLPVLWLAGDSTVASQKSHYPYSPGLAHGGWGQMLNLFLTAEYVLCNLSHSGLTTDTFRSQGHYSILTEQLKPGDYVFIQFGHNDQKLSELLADGRYQENLLRYIDEIREKRAFPVLITPLARNTWHCRTRQYNDLLYKYSLAVKKAAALSQVPLIDLHQISRKLIISLGLEGAKPLFYPGDYTHTNDYGAFKVASLICQEIMKQASLLPLRKLFKHKLPDYHFIPDKNSGWLTPPSLKHLAGKKSGPVNYQDALLYIQKAYKYFSVNEDTAAYENEEIAAARQNGYYIDGLEKDKKPMQIADWLKLIHLASSGRNEVINKPDFLFSPAPYITWAEAMEYTCQLEQNTISHRDNTLKLNSDEIIIEGS